MKLKTGISKNLKKEELKTLVQQYRYGRYCEDRSLSINSSQELLFDSIVQYFSEEQGIQLEAVSPSNKIEGSLFLRHSKWDTDHFGYPVVTVDFVLLRETGYDESLQIMDTLLEAFQRWLEENKIRFVSVLVPTMNLAILHGFERWGFRFIESNIFNKFDLRVRDLPSQPLQTLRQASLEDEPAMALFSKGAFSTQRFYADSHIDPKKADSLYEKWVKTVFNEPLQNILVLDVENKPAAFMVYETKDLRKYFGLQFAVWKMAVINPQLRGKGIGRTFFNSLKSHHREEGMDIVDSCFTLRNLPSFNLHSQCAFKLVSSSVTLHKWFPTK